MCEDGDPDNRQSTVVAGRADAAMRTVCSSAADEPGAAGPTAAPATAILVIEDDDAARARLADDLRRGGHRVEIAVRGDAAAVRREFELIVAGTRAGSGRASSLLHGVVDRQPQALVVLASTEVIVAAVPNRPPSDEVERAGTALSLERFESIVRCALAARSLGRSASAESEPEASIVLSSVNPSMTRAVATARQVAPFDMTVVLTGESGTGKRALAAAMHQWTSRRVGPFVSVPCSREPLNLERREPSRRAVPPQGNAMESDWVAAARGTLYLDEVAELPADLQAKLLRFLDDESAETTTRVIAGTSRNLEDEVGAGRFRGDLFFRLNVVGIHVPPLRERREDLAGLSDQILASVCARHRRPMVRLSDDVRRAFATYAWPGNLRELVTVLERAIVLSRDGTIGLENLPARLVAS